VSMPFFNREFTFTQPDGTQFQVRGTGDQHHAVFETIDGFTVVRDPISGFYHYARVSQDGANLLPTGIRPGSVDPLQANLAPGARPSDAAMRAAATAGSGLPRSGSRWEARRNEHRMALHAAAAAPGIAPAPPKRQTVGQYVGLCLLVQFPDVPGAMTRDEVEAFCNKKGYDGFGNNGSVRDYFFDNSNGKLTYTNLIAPYYTAQHPRSYYTDEQIEQPTRARELIEEALYYHLGKGFDFGGLTADAQQYVYAVNVFYAGPVVNNWSQGLWPHSFHLDTPFALVPGKLAFDYQITNMGTELTLGTFCHENGHMICDFPDLYSYTNDWRGAGIYCLMCAGGLEPNEKNPAQIGAYLKRGAGWTIASTTVTPGSNVTLRAASNEFAIHRRSDTEYFIIENRARAGRDAGLTDAGLAIWHVDELGSNSDAQHSISHQHECSLVQADGRDDLGRNVNSGDDTDFFRAGENDHLSDTTQPNAKWLDGTPSGLDVEHISAAGATMTFSIGAGPSAPPAEAGV
jgi:M6 family metalloprotease-like protein